MKVKQAKDIKFKSDNITNKNNDGAGKFLFLFIVFFSILIGYSFLKTDTNSTHSVSERSAVPRMVNENGFPIKAPVKSNQNKPVSLNFSQILDSAKNGKIETMVVRENQATGTLKDGSSYIATIEHDPSWLSKISESGAEVSIDKTKNWVDQLGTWVPILMGLLFIFWIWRGIRGMSGGGGGMPSLSRLNPTKIVSGKTKTTFADVAGIDQEKQEVSEIVDFLKDPEKFRKLGARVPRGILMSGAPGTGKTLLARAIAGEANVPFFAASGSDFSGIIVGLGVAKIKEIFEMAKKNAPCILFIDEIDAIGMQRGRSHFNDNDREQTLNQLLIEMDGFANNSGVIIIGATNRPDMLDGALLRPGRFDRQVNIELPNSAGREEILNLYAKKIKLADGVNLKDIARGTTGFSGADLENLLNESALHAVRAGRKEVTNEDLEEARDKTLMGPKKNRKMRAEDIKLTAYHEAGHALVSTIYRDITDPIHKATIIPRGRALGMVQKLPIDDKVSITIDEIKADLAINMAGRAAEEIFFGPNKITTGAESDIAQSTRLVRYAITVGGMSDKIGLVAVNQLNTFGGRHHLENASEETARTVDTEVKKWMDVAYKTAKDLLNKNKVTVKKLAEELLKKETLTREEIEAIVIGKKQSQPTTKIKKK